MGELVVIEAAALPWETWPDAEVAAHSPAVWKDLISGDRTASHALSLGVGQLPPGQALARHWHAAPEVYYIIEGTGEITIGEQTRAVGGGTAVFIPGDAPHQLRNMRASPLHFVYVFPVDSVTSLVYHFVPEQDA